MPISVRLYGDLKGKVQAKDSDSNPGSPAKISLTKTKNIKTIGDILQKFDLTQEDLSHIFVNGKYCGPGEQLQEGDRVGLFPTNMALIFAEIEKNHPISVRIRLPQRMEHLLNQSEGMIHIPMGSNVGYVLSKFNLLNNIDDLEISVNEIQQIEKKHILHEGDFVRITYSLD